MRRHILHISVALLAFTLGFVFAVPYEYLFIALPLALLTFLLAKIIPRLDFELFFNLQTLCVVAVSVLFWVAGIQILYAYFSASDDTFVLDYPDEVVSLAPAPADYLPLTESDSGALTGTTVLQCAGTDADFTTYDSIWAGVIDAKAASKPAPLTPSYHAEIKSTVAVSVIVDEQGRVVWAQALSGHRLRRQAAMDAACRARFSPVIVSGRPLRVSGVLTYSFGGGYAPNVPASVED
jgi:TonB family protein